MTQLGFFVNQSRCIGCFTCSVACKDWHDITATSVPNQYRSWLIIQNPGSVVPTPSGQYDVKIYTAGEVTTPAIWGTHPKQWGLETDVWSDVGDDIVTLLDVIYSDRAFISGSNETSITQYLSPNENGTYTTYNG